MNEPATIPKNASKKLINPAFVEFIEGKIMHAQPGKTLPANAQYAPIVLAFFQYIPSVMAAKFPAKDIVPTMTI